MPGSGSPRQAELSLVRNVRFAKAWSRLRHMPAGASCTSALRASIERPTGSLKLNIAGGHSEINAQPSRHRISRRLERHNEHRRSR
jgi:hypothetical protein